MEYRFGFSLLSPTFVIIGVGAWLLPTFFFCITFLTLEELFDDLLKIMSSLNSTLNNLDALKREYHKLCEVADISVYIPLLCFSYYIAVNLRKDNLLLFLLGNLQVGWLQIVGVVLGLILFIEGKDNEKVRYAKQLLVTSIFPYFGYRVL